MAKRKSFTYGEEIENRRWFSETSKWMLGGFAAILFFTYDKLGCLWLKIIETVIAITGIALLFIAYVGFARSAARINWRIKRQEPKYRDKLLRRKLIGLQWSTELHIAYIVAFIMLCIYTLLFFIANQFFCTNNDDKGDTYNIIYSTCDTTETKPVPPINCKGLVAILHDVNFDFDKANLNEKAQINLDSVVTLLQQNAGMRIAIGAHTDNRGDFFYNMTLSKKRADSATHYILGKGIAPDRVIARGYGEIAPIESNVEETGRTKNRRVEFTIVSLGAE